MNTDIAIIWNPTKTDRETLEKGLADALDPDSGPRVRWWETSADDPGQAVAKQAVDAGATTLIVAGGDGTVRAVAEYLAEAGEGIELGIVPLGTGNLLARNLDVPINDVSGAFTRALSGETRSLDVGWVDVELEKGSERHAFVVMVGFGIDAQMIAET
ncbi:MAG: diacylglycerol kinase family protein, partial [Microbacterium sp.]